MCKITITFESISELESFRSQGQTAQSKTNIVYVVQMHYDESTYLGGIFDTLDNAQKCYKDLCKTHNDDPNWSVHILEWNMSEQSALYID